MNPPASPYQPGREIARGGMGAVLDARDNKFARSVAMKVMLHANASEEEKQRFLQEARVLGQLAHPNIVPVHDLGADPHGRLFYTMKLVQGVTLHEILQKLKAGSRRTLAKYPLNQLLTIFQKVCDAVAFAHSRGIVHRDLKPQNIMVGEFGEVLVMDWGLAKILPGSAAAHEPMGEFSALLHRSTQIGTLEINAAEQEEKPFLPTVTGDQLTVVSPPSPAGPVHFTLPPVAKAPVEGLPPVTGSSQMTMEGAVLGTPHYMSPEQASGRIADIDARSDVFSLGGVLYAILTLRPPVDGSSLQEILTKVCSGTISPPMDFNPENSSRRADGSAVPPKDIIPLAHCPEGRVPDALSAVVMKALQPARVARYQSVADFARDLEAYQTGFATSAENANSLTLMRLFLHRHKTLAAAAAVIVLLTMGFLAKVISSEHKARESAQEAKQNAASAQASAQVARTNEVKAIAAEKEAIAEKESTRRALARAQTALADAALRDLDGAAARAALRAVPEDLRDTSWGYLLARSDPSMATLRSVNSGVIRGIAPNPIRPGVFAIAGQDDYISLVDSATGTRLVEFRSALGNTRGGSYFLSFTPDGEELAVASPAAGKIVFQSTRDGRKLREWATPPPFAMELSPGGRQLLLIPEDRAGRTELQMHDANSGALTWSHDARSSWIHSAFHPSGRSIVVAAGMTSVRLLDSRDGSEIRPLPNSGPFVHALAVSPDGELAAYGDEQGGLRCARLKDGQLVLDFRAAGCAIRQLRFTPDGRRLVTLTYPDNRSYNHVRVWDARSGYLLQAVLGAEAMPTQATLHPLSGELVIIGDQTKSWDLTQIEPQWSLTASVNAPWVGFWGGDDSLFYFDAVGSPRVARLGANGTDTILWRSGNTSQRPAASVSADGRFALAGSQVSPAEFFLLKHEGSTVKELARWKPATIPRLLRLSPAGDRVWTGVHLLDAATGQQLQAFAFKVRGNLLDGHWLSSNRIAFAVIDNARSVLAVADATSAEMFCTVTNDSRVFAFGVSPGGRLIAEAGQDKLVRLRDPETLAVRREFRAHDGGITALAFHPREPILATASDDLTMRVWNFETGAMLEEIRGPQVIPISLAWGSDGKRLASTGIDRLVRVWEPRSLNSRPISASTNSPGDWENLLTLIKPEDLATNGQDWAFDNGSLRSPDRMYATVPLPGDFANASYHLQLKFRRLTPMESLTVFMPVAGRQTGFLLDGYPGIGHVSGLHYVDGEGGAKQPNAVLGLQVNDSEAHQLDFIIRIGPVTAIIDVKLDERSIYRWAGLPAALSMNGRFKGIGPGQIGLGAHKAEWVIQSARAKRL